MTDIIHVGSVSQLHSICGFTPPLHPLVSLIDLSHVTYEPHIKDVRFTTALYSVALKQVPVRHQVTYGRSILDFEDAVLFATAPGQVQAYEATASSEPLSGWILYFHPDLIRSYPLQSKIANYGFFSYEVAESLHTSDAERGILTGVANQIQQEYNTGIDEFTQDVLVGNIALLLSYIQRYYSRQFITRRTQNRTVLAQFEHLLRDALVTDTLELNGLPTVAGLANALGLSSNYLSDLLKRETGKTTQEHIHYQVIEQAKIHLLGSDATVTEISHQLGFEYPQYFSRMFKKKTGLSPSAYRNYH